MSCIGSETISSQLKYRSSSNGIGNVQLRVLMMERQKENKRIYTHQQEKHKKKTQMQPLTSSFPIALTLKLALFPKERAEAEVRLIKATESRSAHQKTDQTQLFHRALPLSFFLSPSALDTKMKQNAKPIGESTKIRQNAHDTQLSQTSQIRSCHRAISSITARPWRLVLCSRRARSFVFRMM
jgi:hypothetical protein